MWMLRRRRRRRRRKMLRFRRMMLRRKTDPKTGKHTLCEPASLRNRNAHGHCTRAISCGNSKEKGRTPILRHSFCASLRSRNAHGHFTRAILYGNLQEKWPRTPPGPAFCASLHFVRACTVEMHMGMSQEVFCAEIDRENAGRFRYHLD